MEHAAMYAKNPEVPFCELHKHTTLQMSAVSPYGL